MKAQFLTPVVTVFHKDGTLDLEGNQKVYDYLLSGGMDGLVLMGSTGEFFSMTMEMQKQLIDFAASNLKDRTRVLVGVSRMISDEVIELANYAYDKGLTEVMVVSPYYFRLAEDNLFNWFSQIAQGTSASIFLYNYPDRTAHDLNSQLVLRLARAHQNIVGIKDTVTEMGHTSDILCTLKPEFPDFQVFSGYDDNLVHNVMSGGAGVIGGLSNLMPKQCATWARAIDAGDLEGIVSGQQFINKAMVLYDMVPLFVPMIKCGLQMLGLEIDNACTAPIPALSDAQETALRRQLKQLGIL